MRLGDPGLFVTHALGATRTSTAFDDIDNLGAASILLDLALVRQTAARVAWDSQGTQVVVWSLEVLGNDQLDGSRRWDQVDGAVLGH